MGSLSEMKSLLVSKASDDAIPFTTTAAATGAGLVGVGALRRRAAKFVPERLRLNASMSQQRAYDIEAAARSKPRDKQLARQASRARVSAEYSSKLSRISPAVQGSMKRGGRNMMLAGGGLVAYGVGGKLVNRDQRKAAQFYG